MRISSANVDMYSGRTYSVESYEQETIKEVSKTIHIPIVRMDSKETEQTSATVEEVLLTKRTEIEQAEEAEREAAEKEARREAQDTGEEGLKEQTTNANYVYVKKVSTAEEKKDLRTIRQQCIQYLLEVIFMNRERRRNGESIRNISYQEWLSERENQNSQANGYFSYSKGTLKTVQSSKTCYFSEQERTSYQTTGTVVTADGREIEFNLEFAMSRSFEKYYNENYETDVVSFCDPLVINLDSTMPHVSDQKFLFDLDADGVMDTISMLANKSGYLAIDKNEDGTINDGNELFGTKSGDGFSDLSEYDKDGNGWIDEDDEIWNKLMIWCMDESGKSELYHISEKGIGAICLKNVSSDFSLNSLKTNQTNAAVRSTGIFLYENGNVGTVQHMDLAI